MEQQIAADAPLDCIEFRISPENNYYVFVCCGELEEKVECVAADQISAHLPAGPVSEGLCDDIKLQLPEHLDDTTWFTKATIRRFLKTIDSPEPLRKIITLSNEMSQLGETRKFQISLYTQAEKRTASSDDSKNELLRAMDLRLTALGKELIATFNQAVGGPCSLDDMKALEKFCDFVGNIDLRNSLSKLLESSQNSKVNNYFDHRKPPVTSETRSDPVYSTALNTQISKPSNLDHLVKYGASPAKVAQVERQSVSESEESSNSGEEEDRTSAERSRSRMRSATPRRSASPMRRIQIGRSGSRRTPAIGIRSLTYFPGRERAFTLRDSAQDNDGEGDGTEHGIKIPESNVRRMSVQDAINLFERKQKDQSTDAQQRKSQVDNPVKPVLRRWSSAMSESSAQKVDHCISENKVADSQRLVNEEVSNVAREIHPETAAANLSESARDMETGEQLERGDDVGSLSPYDTDITVSLEEELSKKVDSAEWNRQKEEELNRMLMSFALSKPKNKHQKTGSQDIKKKDSQTGKKGGIQDQPKNRRNVEMATVKQVTKKTDKQGPSRTVRKSFDKTTKVEFSSADGCHVGKKEVAVSTQKEKVVKRSPLSANIKRELPKPIVNNAPAKSSSLPTTRKSWPSTPASRSTRTTAAKPPPDMTTSSSALSRQKTQLSTPLPRSTSKLETFQSERKEVSKIKVESKQSSQSADENKLQVAPKSARTGKAKVASASEVKSSTVPVKPGASSKITKKSTVVPLESKPSKKARKGPTASPVPKKRGGPSVKEPLIKCETPIKRPLNKSESSICDQDNEVVILQSSETTNQNAEEQPKTEKVCHVDLESEAQLEYLPPCDDQEGIPCENPAKCNEKIEKTTVSSPAAIQHEEESSISPTAWVDVAQQDLPIPSGESAPELTSSTNRTEVASSGSRVRHSLSQMLLEDSSDPDIVEWGNAENPPSLIFQRDAPKGLKRLLKFARKNKGDANMAGYASSPYTSEGEDDGDESKGFGRRNSDNLLKKAALNASNYGHHVISSEGLADSEPLSARSNASNSSFHSTSSATSKASRSFFSLSAFRGNKATDTKMR